MEEEKDIFKDLAGGEPDRGEELDDEEIPEVSPSSLQAESMSPNDTDLQTTLKMLNPTFTEPELQEIAPVVMQGRVFPDNFTSKVYLITTSVAKSHRHDNKFDVIRTMMKAEGMCQIGFEGKNRVETVIVSGNTKEVAEQEANRTGGF